MKSLTKHIGVYIRPWTVEDAHFCLTVRNHPALMKYFRQDKPITLGQQWDFINADTSPYGEYNGRIIEYYGRPVGLCGIKNSSEFTLGILPEYQHKGIATKVMKHLTHQWAGIWSEVFVGNPALEWFISVIGFKVMGVRERAYYKEGVGLVDVVLIKFPSI